MGESDGDDTDPSVIDRLHWLVAGQFGDSETDRIRSVNVTMGLATVVLTLSAATSALLADLRNWPVAGVLMVLGALVFVFVLNVALNPWSGSSSASSDRGQQRAH